MIEKAFNKYCKASSRAVLVLSVLVLIVLVLIFVVLTWFSVLLGIAIWAAVLAALRMMAKADPMMRQVYLRHIGYRAGYRPTASPWRRP